MTFYILSEPISITEIFDEYKIIQNRHAVLALILKSEIVHNRNLLCNEMCRDIAMSKHGRKACVSESRSEEAIAGFCKIYEII